MEKFLNFSSVIVPFPYNNVDTDQIYPARFLIATDKMDMKEKLFKDLREDEEGNPRSDFILNNPWYQGTKILMALDNFGSGSSREHAVWALAEWGFCAVIAVSFGDIFRNNAYKNGLLPIQLPKDIIDQMHVDAAVNPQEMMEVNLERQRVRWKEREYTFDINPFIKACILKGVDEIGYTLHYEQDIRAFEEAHK